MCSSQFQIILIIYQSNFCSELPKIFPAPRSFELLALTFPFTVFRPNLDLHPSRFPHLIPQPSKTLSTLNKYSPLHPLWHKRRLHLMLPCICTRRQAAYDPTPRPSRQFYHGLTSRQLPSPVETVQEHSGAYHLPCAPCTRQGAGTGENIRGHESARECVFIAE